MQNMNLQLCEFGPDVMGLDSLSPFCLKVLRALKYHGLPFTRLHSNRPGAFIEHNETGQVPILLVNGEATPDSTMILKKLETISERSLLPEAKEMKAEAWLWEEFADSVLFPFTLVARWADNVNWPICRQYTFGDLPPLINIVVPQLARRGLLKRLSREEIFRHGPEACWQLFQQHLEHLDARSPAAGYWLGSDLTVADISLFAQLQSLRTPMTQWQMEQIDRHARLAAWLNRVEEATRG
jgi:glutathione S-transferase